MIPERSCWLTGTRPKHLIRNRQSLITDYYLISLIDQQEPDRPQQPNVTRQAPPTDWYLIGIIQPIDNAMSTIFQHITLELLPDSHKTGNREALTINRYLTWINTWLVPKIKQTTCSAKEELKTDWYQTSTNNRLVLGGGLGGRVV